MISNRNLRHFYSATHFVSIISLYLGFIQFFCKLLLLLPIVISFSVVFVFDSIVIVSRFFIFVFTVMTVMRILLLLLLL